MGLRGAGEVKNFSVGICDGAPSTARFSYYLYFISFTGFYIMILCYFKNKNINFLQHDSFNNLFPILCSEKTMPEIKRAGKNP